MLRYFQWRRRRNIIQIRKELPLLTLSNYSILEHSIPTFPVANVFNSKFRLDLIDSAGGRFMLWDKQILAGPVNTDYEESTWHKIVLRESANFVYKDTEIIIQVINRELL